MCVHHKRYIFACACDRKKRFVYVKCKDLRCAGVFFYVCVCLRAGECRCPRRIHESGSKEHMFRFPPRPAL